jgi:hypothetical protein
LTWSDPDITDFIGLDRRLALAALTEGFRVPTLSIIDQMT